MMPSELEQAKAIVAEVAPGKVPELTCMLVAAAIAGMRGLTMRHIRVGALFWPDKFHDEPYLSMRGGWGCEGFSGGKLYLAEQTVDQEDGSFAGHTWLEDGVWLIDRMHDYEGDSREIYDGTLTVIGRYIPRRKLEYAVKRYWRAQMREAIRLGGAAG